jgi:hypothetical protein
MPVVLAGCSRHPSWACQQREVEGAGELAVASVLRPGQEAGKRLEMAANGFRERSLESVINRPDTVSAMNA